MPEQFTIIFEPAEEGGYIATIPEVPGAFSQGESIEEAREMVIDAMRELIAYRLDKALATKSEGSTVEKIPLTV